MELNRKIIAFAIFSDPMIYPPTMNAAAILAENGFEIDIFGMHYNSGDLIAPATGVRINYLGELRKGLQFRIDFIKFCAKVSRAALSNRYEWIFSYNMTGVIPGFLAARLLGSNWLYHNHDMSPVSQVWGFYPFLKKAENWTSRRANLVVFPQKERADLFTETSRLVNAPLIVWNGPRKNWTQGDILEPEILEFRRRCGQVVIYQGGLNWMRGLRRVIQSMPHWDIPAGLLLVGGAGLQPSFTEDATSLARSLGVENRLLIKPIIPYHELPKFTKACDIGLGVMATAEDDPCLNIQHLAGASNKLVEYMACGLPVVVPATEAYRDFVEEKGIGVLADNRSPQTLAAGLNKLLSNLSLQKEISARAKKVFESTLNYDVQFQPVLDVVLSTYSQ